MPAHHVFYNRGRQAVGFEQLEYFLPEQRFQKKKEKDASRKGFLEWPW